jgi:adenylate kinase family enzyme
LDKSYLPLGRSLDIDYLDVREATASAMLPAPILATLRRIAIIGCGGSGKSFLARELARRTGIEVTHLDTLYWDAEWQPRQGASEWEELQRRLVAADAWIMDGNYDRTMDLRLAAADTVIFLDLPTHVCLRRVLVRRLQSLAGHGRPEIAGRERASLAFLRWILGYRRKSRPKVLERLARLAPGTSLVTLKSQAEVEAYLGSV